MGKYVLIEGIDGAGKTTICELLSKKLGSAAVIKQPSNDDIGNFIRVSLENKREYMKNSLVAMLLFFADTLSLKEKIRDLKERYEFLISDRGFLSTYAYQLALTKDEEEKKSFIKIFNELLKFAEIPDLIIVLDVEVETAIERLMKAQKKTSLYENKDFLRKVLENYRNIELDLENVYLIDANRSVEEVLEDVLKVIRLL